MQIPEAGLDRGQRIDTAWSGIDRSISITSVSPPRASGPFELDLLVGPERCDADQAMATFRAILTRADLSP